MAQRLLLENLLGRPTDRVPFWFMRQAGRYLPEYRELRKSAGGFLELVFDPKKAAEVTLQPIRRFGMDGAILFSDILVVPYAMGAGVAFAEGEGPIVERITDAGRIGRLALDEKKLQPIYETLRLTKKELPAHVTLLGFAGAPWTVAAYLLREKGDKEFSGARAFAYAQPKLMQQLVDAIGEATVVYLTRQVEAGAQAVQLFDSWAGLLAPDQFERWVLQPTAKIVAALKPTGVPVIGFARGAGQHLAAYAGTGLQCVGVDQQTDMATAISALGKKQAVQGNLDPLLLAADKDGALRQAEKILRTFGDRPAIFNFGHGMLPHTPVDHVAALCDLLKAARR